MHPVGRYGKAEVGRSCDKARHRRSVVAAPFLSPAADGRLIIVRLLIAASSQHRRENDKKNGRHLKSQTCRQVIWPFAHGVGSMARRVQCLMNIKRMRGHIQIVPGDVEAVLLRQSRIRHNLTPLPAAMF